MTSQGLGPLISTHGTSPKFVQRAAVVALASFAFFLVMMAAFYARPQIGYFVLATAFLVVALFTLIGIWMQKRSVVKIHEKGLAYKKLRASWSEIRSVKADASGLTIVSDDGSVVIPRSIERYDLVVKAVRTALP